VSDLIWALEERQRPQVVVLDCRAMVDVEYTALKALAQLDDKLRRHDVEFWLAGMTPAVFAVVERSAFGTKLGRERMFLNMQAAVERFERRGRT
jgi:anti-anti-sigma regulatory factor